MDNKKHWELLIKALEESGVNVKVVEEVLTALVKISGDGGYGKVNISILGGLIQEIRVEQTKRVEQYIMKNTVSLPTIDRVSDPLYK